MRDNRRDFLKKTTLFGLAGLAGSLIGNGNIQALQKFDASTEEGGKATLPALPYAYDALEPFIDKQTMEIHHTKHHQAYIDKLNTAPEADYNRKLSETENCKKVTEKTSPLVRNNLGGHLNHSLFWTLLAPNSEKKNIKPAGKSAEAINKSFKSFEDFQKEFTDKATKHFGSGWCWLVTDEKKNLKIVCTANQDNPLMQISSEKGTPILALDVWEHAYYLKYQNKRAEYIANWWNIVNWQKVEELFSAVK